MHPCHCGVLVNSVRGTLLCKGNEFNLIVFKTVTTCYVTLAPGRPGCPRVPADP